MRKYVSSRLNKRLYMIRYRKLYKLTLVKIVRYNFQLTIFMVCSTLVVAKRASITYNKMFVVLTTSM